MNINFGLIDDLPQNGPRQLKGKDKRQALALCVLSDLATWKQAQGLVTAA